MVIAAPSTLRSVFENSNSGILYKSFHRFYSSIKGLTDVINDITMVAFIIHKAMNPICLNSFTIKSRSAQMHLRKIWLHGQIFISHAHEVYRHWSIMGCHWMGQTIMT